MILIVDDNPVNTKLLAYLLGGRGYSIRSADNAIDAIAAVHASRPRLILMDVQLPGMNGLELTTQLRRSPANADIVVIAVTAYAMKGDAERALEAGCDAYLSKPIDTRTFPDTVAKWLASGRVAR